MERIMAKTTRTFHRFYVKEHEFGRLWLVAKPFGKDELPTLQGGFFGFDLAPGATMRQAHELKETMNRMIVGTSHTQFRD
jgi:hypothetical protein